MPRPPGRPSLYTPALAEAICARLADGESLRTICADPAMPGRTTIRQWLNADPEFRLRYARAREEQAHALAELAVEVALAATDPQKGRLAFDALRWYASKLAPKAYGDRIEVEQAVRAVVSAEPMSMEEWVEKYCPADPAEAA